MVLSAEGALQLAAKHDTGGLWNGLPLWGSGHITGRVRTGYFAGGLVALTFRRRPTLIVCGHVNFGPLALALHHALGIPYVLLAFGIDVGLHLSRWELRALRGARAVWSISRWTRRRVLACGVAEENVRILPVTFQETAFDVGPASAVLRARHSIGPNDKVILTVGRLDSRERYKGYDKVLMALPAVHRAVGPVRYLIVGQGDDIARLRALAAQLGVDEQVTFCGFVSDLELADYYRLATVFAMPSVAEGFGIVFLEAMACGVPVLGGNKDGTTDALADGDLGLLVDPESTEAISDGLISLLACQGPAMWFSPHDLRRRCLALHGQRVFSTRVRAAIQPLLRTVLG